MSPEEKEQFRWRFVEKMLPTFSPGIQINSNIVLIVDYIIEQLEKAREKEPEFTYDPIGRSKDACEHEWIFASSEPDNVMCTKCWIRS